MPHFKTPSDAADAKRRFETKRKQYEKVIHDAASGDNETDDTKKLAEKRRRIRDEMGDLLRFVSDDSAERDRLSAKLDALGARFVEAEEKGYHARHARRDRDISRLNEEIRANRPRPGSYEHDLALYSAGLPPNRRRGY